MGTITFGLNEICGFGLRFTLDGFRVLYVLIATFMWASSMLFSLEYMHHYTHKVRYYVFSAVTYVATAGVFLSADLLTTFVFFEIMSLTSYVWVVQDERKESLRAGDTYLAVAVIGGLVMLMGIFMLYVKTGTTDLTAVGFDGSSVSFLAGVLMLFGFAAKAGGFPLHIWLPKAHPVAPAPASALLSGILTKAGVFGILLLSCYMFYGSEKWGTLILTIGVITMFLGALLALFSIDLKRTLACSSVSQIGFILTGIGMYDLLGAENTLAARGTLMHMVNHSMIKLLLFMAAGVVYMNLHELDLNKIRGFGRKKPLLKVLFLSGALGIGGIPLFNGYISKTLIHESIVEYRELLEEGHAVPFVYGTGMVTLIEWIFIISGGITVAYMTKLFVSLFIEENRDAGRQRSFDENHTYMNRLSAAVLILPAVFMPLAGMLPHVVADSVMDLGQGFLRIEEAERIAYFSGTNLLGGFYSILIGAFLYFVVVRKCLMKDGEYVNRWPKYLDLEESFYRPLLLVILPAICTFVCRIADKLVDLLVPVLLQIGVFFCRIFDRLVDLAVVVLRKTVFKEERLPQEMIEGNPFSHLVGGYMDRTIHFLNETVWEYRPRKENAEHKLAMQTTWISENYSIIGRSLSFALALAGMGLILILLYMLI
ncbi:MAG: NADH dehydrogenase [Lachnospiraceae bacterium]|nr:NADH dehydrogenase [Lachnospiraceae bacterium]